MDYNEMAMHFDKMVRRHNVARVLNQARQLFAGYLRRHSASSSRSDYVSVWVLLLSFFLLKTFSIEFNGVYERIIKNERK